MPLERHPKGQHHASCHSPDDCLEYRDMLSETTTQAARRCAEQTASMLRTATAGQVFRISQPRPEPVRKTASEWRDHLGHQLRGYGSVVTDTPNPYGEVMTQAPCPHDDKDYSPHGQPPDGYAIAINRMKKERT